MYFINLYPYLLIFQLIYCTKSFNRNYTGLSSGSSFCLSAINNKMDESQFPRQFIPHINLGGSKNNKDHYAILHKNDNNQSKFTIELESNPSTGYSWYSVGIYERKAIPPEPYHDSLKNIINKEFVTRKVEEGSTLDGLFVSPFNFIQKNQQSGFYGAPGISTATISATPECKSGDYLILLAYAQPFNPLGDSYYIRLYLRVI